jgi:LysR family transcriptional regulator, carnitine catabolism transcriptional activator
MTPSFPDISFKHLNAIVSLARFGSFIAAASYLGISQPGLTRIVQQTEKKLKTELFVRGQRSVSLTPAGQEFLPYAEHAISAFIKQTEDLQASHTLPETRLNISCLMSISHLVLPMALVEFRKAYPQVAVEIREGVGSAVHDEVREGRVDFGIGSVEDQPPNVVAESVMDEALYAILPRDHPLTRNDVLRLLDLKETPMISMPIDSGLRRVIDAAAIAVGINLAHKVVTNQYSSLFSFVSNGLGVAIVPASVLPPVDDELLVVRSLTPSMTRQIGVIHLNDKPLNAASESFLRTLRPLLTDAIAGAR